MNKETQRGCLLPQVVSSELSVPNEPRGLVYLDPLEMDFKNPWEKWSEKPIPLLVVCMLMSLTFFAGILLATIQMKPSMGSHIRAEIMEKMKEKKEKEAVKVVKLSRVAPANSLVVPTNPLKGKPVSAKVALSRQQVQISCYLHNSLVATKKLPTESEIEKPSTEKTEKSSMKSESEKSITILTTGKVVMYQRDDESSDIVQFVGKGEKITSVVESSHGFLLGRYNGKWGHFHHRHTNYLDKKKIFSSIYREKRNFQGVVTVECANLRSKPGLTSKSKVIKHLDKGTVYNALTVETMLHNDKHTWSKIQLSTGEIGYFYNKFGSAVENGENPTNDSLKGDNKKGHSNGTQTENLPTGSDENDKDNAGPTEGEGHSKGSSKPTEGEGYSTGKTFAFPFHLKVTDYKINTLGCVGVAEVGDRFEQDLVMQVLKNKADFYKVTLRAILSSPNQYPVTWKKVQAGTLKPSKKTKKSARAILEGQKNGFEGTNVPKKFWNKVMYQASDDPSHWTYPVTVVAMPPYTEHYYALGYLLKDKKGKPVYYLNGCNKKNRKKAA